MSTDYEANTFQKRPCYRYIRQADHLPTTKEARDEAVPMARLKFFDPTGSWTWYVAGYDPKTRIAWGLVDGFEREIGDFYMPELVAIRGRFSLPIERDLYWTPCPLAEVK